VFNIEQVKGNIKPWDNVELKNKDTVELSKKAEEFIKNTEAKIEHVGNKACYIPSKDFIRIPEKKAFIDTKNSSSTANYYGVLFHELTHWTGHDSRLKREFKGFFGSPEYAFEELVAELGSAYACNQLDIAVTPRLDHACYLKSWMRAIKDNKQSLIKASGLANKALTFMNEKQPIHEISAVA
jgi:antirestriction protein ArdC